MRVYALILASMASATALADPRACGDGALTPKQMVAAFEGKTDGDPVLVEASSLPRLHPLPPVALAKNPKSISWDKARTMILLGAVVKIFETVDLAVRVTTRGGNTYVAKEPRYGDVSRILDLVDPCHAFIIHIVE